MKFFNEQHKNKYLEFINKDQTKDGDVHRLAILYILSSEYLRDIAVNELYDFEKHQIKFFRDDENDDIIKINPNYSRAASTLACLAFHLFNYLHDDGVTPDELFDCDRQTKFIALNAIKIRYELDSL